MAGLALRESRGITWKRGKTATASCSFGGLGLLGRFVASFTTVFLAALSIFFGSAFNIPNILSTYDGLFQ